MMMMKFVSAMLSWCWLY